MPADLLESYRPLRVLKEGAGICTYLGRDPHTGNPLRIKSTRKVDPGERLRLLHESRLVEGARIEEAGDVLALIAPFYPGVTLRERLRDGPLELPEFLDFALALAGELAAPSCSFQRIARVTG